MDLSAVLTPALSDYHWLRRPLHGSLHRSCVAVVYPTLELICDFRPSKFSHYPSRYPKFLSLADPTRPATRRFCHYPTRSRPEVKNHYPSVSGYQRVTSCLSKGYQRVLSGLSEGYQWVIRGLTDSYQRVIRGLSEGYQQVIPQRVISWLSEGYQWVICEL